MLESQFKDNLSFYTYLITLISFISGSFYLLGYWITFDIIIFPFISLHDLIKSAAYPFLMLYMPWIFLHWIIFSLHLDLYFRYFKRKLSKHEMTYIILVLCTTFIAGAIGVYLGIKTLIFGYPFSSIIMILYIKTKSRALLIASIMPLIPAMAYDYGHFKADKILSGHEFAYVPSELSIDKSDKFLGYINDHYFFLNQNSNEIIIYSKIDIIKLRTFTKDKKLDSSDIGYTY